MRSNHKPIKLLILLIFLGFGAFGKDVTNEGEGKLTVVKEDNTIVIMSDAPPTWKIKFGIAKEGSQDKLAGGIAYGLYIPASEETGVVQEKFGIACCSAVGLDNMEWRYTSSSGNGRADVGSEGKTADVNFLEESEKRVVIEIKGSWPNVPRYTRVLTITPQGFEADIELTYECADITNGCEESSWTMWWPVGAFMSSRLYAEGTTIQDNDTPPTKLPMLAGEQKLSDLPVEITSPYGINWPVVLPDRLHNIKLIVEKFGDRYRFDTDKTINGATMNMFYPRLVQRKSLVGNYHFNYSWIFSGG
jgi:hypothetical protein